MLIISVMNVHANGIRKGCSIIERFEYPFFHANIFHAAINIYVYLGMVFLLGTSLIDMFIAYVISACVPTFLLSDTTTIGLSGVVYALIGMNTFKVANPLKYTFSVIIPLAFTSLLPLVAVGVHAWCYVVGVVYSVILLCWKRLKG